MMSYWSFYKLQDLYLGSLKKLYKVTLRLVATLLGYVVKRIGSIL